MACEGCTQKMIEQNFKSNEIIILAQKEANEKKEWIGIYTDEFGVKRIAQVGSGRYPFEHIISPKLQDTDL